MSFNVFDKKINLWAVCIVPRYVHFTFVFFTYKAQAMSHKNIMTSQQKNQNIYKRKTIEFVICQLFKLKVNKIE